MIILEIFAAIIAFIILFYLLSRVQMKAWTQEFDGFLNDKLKEYLPKKEKDEKREID
jgi:hypothetical protein